MQTCVRRRPIDPAFLDIDRILSRYASITDPLRYASVRLADDAAISAFQLFPNVRNSCLESSIFPYTLYDLY
jgi:hypothetical protein